MKEFRPLRVLVDVNNTLYQKIKGSQVAVCDNEMPDITSEEREKLVRNIEIQKKGRERFGIKHPFSADNFLKIYQEEFIYYRLIEMAGRGLKYLSNSVGLDGKRVKVTLLSNMPEEKKDYLIRRVESDKILQCLDPDLPVVLRPDSKTHQARFKLEAAKTFAKDEKVIVVDDDYYIGYLIKQCNPGVLVHNPLTVDRVERQPLVAAGSVPLNMGICLNSGILNVYTRLYGLGYIKPAS